MNAWSAISANAASALRRDGSRRLRSMHIVAAAAIIPVSAVVAVLVVGSPSSAHRATAQTTQEERSAAQVLQSLAAVPAVASAQPGAPADEPESVRITGTVGHDLTQSLRAAGVPDRQGREYVSALASAIRLDGGLSVDDRFDLVIVKSADGSLGDVAYAGLDRVGRSDLELMKWTDGHETRWVNADGAGSAEGMEMPVSGRITSGFGERFHPILGYRRMHDGVDLAAPFGTPIVAAADGRVVTAGWHGGYGREVAIVHPGGVETLYGHMSRLAASAGEVVRRGQVIGYVGSSGLSTGPHLHYEVHLNGKLVNPLSVKLTQAPLQGEELRAFQSRLRGLLLGQGVKA